MELRRCRKKFLGQVEGTFLEQKMLGANPLLRDMPTIGTTGRVRLSITDTKWNVLSLPEVLNE